MKYLHFHLNPKQIAMHLDYLFKYKNLRIMHTMETLHTTGSVLLKADASGIETLTSSMFRIQFLMLSNDFSLVIS